MFNKVAGTIKGVAGILFFIGLGIACLLLKENIVAAVIIVFNVLVVSLFLVGFGEIIEKLNQIEINTRPKYETPLFSQEENKNEK